jgi:hypothetical protein
MIENSIDQSGIAARHGLFSHKRAELLPAFDEILNSIHAPERHNPGRAIRFPPSADFLWLLGIGSRAGRR